MAWGITLWRLDFSAGLLRYLSPEQANYLWLYLGIYWLAYYSIGTMAVLLFRHWYYRKQWYKKTFIASFPLALLTATAAGMSLAFLVHLPFNQLLDIPFEIIGASGEPVIVGVFSVSLFIGTELSVLLLLWVLLYWGISGTLNARDLSIKALALENNLKEARLNSLSGQINPHFLFNALNNIRFMIRQDADRAEDSLVALSEILRHSLGSSQKEKVPLSEELAIVERYLSLIKNQMGDRLDYSIRSEAVSNNNLIPPMIIQMLAENAIKHGIDHIREGGEVNIQCTNIADKLRIKVGNTAPFSGSDTDNSMAPSGSLNKGTDAGEQGIGLANISKRLILLYGDNAHLSMGRENGDFEVVLELPKEEA